MDNIAIRFSDVIEKDEQLLWTGKPKFLPFVLSSILIGLGEIAVAIPMVTLMNNPDNERSFAWPFGLILILIGLGTILNKLLSFGNTFYACSARRVMVRSGGVDTTITIINFDEIVNVQVKLGFFEQPFKAGTIRFFSGRTQTDTDSTNVSKVYDNWEAIPDPYGTFKKVQQIMAGIKNPHI